MITFTTCPVCDSLDEADFEQVNAGGYDAERFRCDVCGNFRVARTATVDGSLDRLSRIQRAALSWRIRQAPGPNIPMITTHTVDEMLKSKQLLPDPAQQASNIIRLIGDHYLKTGERFEEFPKGYQAEIGAVSRDFADQLAVELKLSGLLSANEAGCQGRPYNLFNISLTLAGWNKYEAEKRGRFSGRLGFIALKFGDSVLDQFLANHIKPAVAELSDQLFDMRDRGRAGIIDNLMRAEIRDAAFVIADLTHDNAGAYWEAGYAEGLGKPVLYICEKAKFAVSKTHFDTNHSTTIPWDADEPSQFRDDLKATLRRSLGLFDG